MRGFKRLLIPATLVLLSLQEIPPASAADAGAILIYPASSFADAEFNTAHDMVTRLPGFVFIDTDTTQRGFAGSAGNVLINGVRPASKTDILSAVLDRIAISRVDRIEVIRGSAPGIDMQGQTVIANIDPQARRRHPCDRHPARHHVWRWPSRARRQCRIQRAAPATIAMI